MTIERTSANGQTAVQTYPSSSDLPSIIQAPAGTISPGDETIQTTQISGSRSEWSIFGIHLQDLTDDNLSLAHQLGSRWVREDLKWYLVEPTEGERNWNSLAELEQDFKDSAQKGFEIIAIIGGTPKWALKDGYSCGAIAPDKLETFGQFVKEVVERYSVAPYNIKNWEFYNEPDTAGVLGCWGDANDEYFGGAYYAEMLKVVYTQVKVVDPNANVLVGGLLLDCDPRPESNWCEFWGHDERPPKFLEGILLNDGGDYFDGISFHGYDYFDYTDPQLGEYLNPIWGTSWNGTQVDGSPGYKIGPVIIYKAQYINGLLGKYSVFGKFLLNSEVALICGGALDPPGGNGCESNDDSLFEQTKARYVTEAYTVAFANNLKANIWFDLYGWRNSGLLHEDLEPRPSYYAYQVLYEELGNANFIKEISVYPNVMVYEFRHNENKIWIVWSSDGDPHHVTLPATPEELKDFMGNFEPPDSSFIATIDPHYLIWKP